MREQVEAGRLAGAVRADQRVDRAAADREVDVLDGDEALELLGEPARFEDGVVGHAPTARRCVIGARAGVSEVGRGLCGWTPALAMRIRDRRFTRCRHFAARASRGTRRCPRRHRAPACCRSSPRRRARRRRRARARAARRTPACRARSTAGLFATIAVGERGDGGVELAGGTTRLTSPQSSAVAASMIAGEQHLHRALARHVARDADGGRRAEEADVDAGQRELRRRRRRPRGRTSTTSWQPAAAAMPCTRAITGCGSCVQLQHHRGCSASNSSLLPGLVGVRAHLLEVVAGAEALPAPARTTTRTRRDRPRSRRAPPASASSIARRQRIELRRRGSASACATPSRVRAQHAGVDGTGLRCGAFIAGLLASLDRRRRLRLLAQHELLDLAGRRLGQRRRTRRSSAP